VVGAPYLSSMYYKYMANRPLFLNPDNLNLYHGDPSNTVAVGDVEGNPVAATNWRSHCNVFGTRQMEGHAPGDQHFQPVLRRTLFLVSGGKTVGAGVISAVKMQRLMTMEGRCQAGEDCSFNMMIANKQTNKQVRSVCTFLEK
jgi:hypothetical protein